MYPHSTIFILLSLANTLLCACGCFYVEYRCSCFTSRSTGGNVEPHPRDILVKTGLEWRERKGEENVTAQSVWHTHTNNFRSVLQAQIHTYTHKLITLEMYSNKPHTLAHCWLGPGPLRKHELRLMNNSRTEQTAKLEALVLCLIGRDDLTSKYAMMSHMMIIVITCFIDYSCSHKSWFKHQMVDVLSGWLKVWLLT